MITDIRLHSQQLVNSQYDNPQELVKWMGAVQAQEYNMAKWALGLRTKEPNLGKVEEALATGSILRVHILRPTWHFIAAEDIHWMLSLCSERMLRSLNSCSQIKDFISKYYKPCHNIITKTLTGRSLSKEELNTEFKQHKIELETHQMNLILMRAELEGIICSGIEKNNKFTYALLEERVPSPCNKHKEEALGELAIRYFQSHSPASLEDFTWWSGLTIREAKQTIHLIHSHLIEEKIEDKVFFIHEIYQNGKSLEKDVLHFLPSYDEYLISYKSRFPAINPDNYAKAFNAYGIFYPIIMYNGKIVGNWKKMTKKGQINMQTSFFDTQVKIPSQLLKQAEKKYIDFWNKTS